MTSVSDHTKAASVQPARAASRARPGVYCVVGSHRSGTSLLSSILKASGVDMGSRLLPPQPDNPRGFFEDEDFFVFHERCLGRRGLTYADDRIPEIELTSQERDEALELISARADAPAWGWKDPRTCLFLRSWHALLPDARYIVVFRHPVAVVSSLIRRGEPAALASPSTALRAWVMAMTRVAEFLHQVRPAHAVLEADAMFDDPAGVAESLEPLGLPITGELVRQCAHAGEFRRIPEIPELDALVETVAPGASAALTMLRAAARGRVDRDPPDAPTVTGVAALAAAGLSATPSARDHVLRAVLAMIDPGAGEQLERQRDLAANAASRITAVEMRTYAESLALQRLVEQERDSARRNYERALSAEAAAKSNYDRALVAEQASRENYDRALSAEAQVEEQRRVAARNHERAVAAQAASEANFTWATGAEAASRDNYARALSAEAASKANYERALAAEDRVREILERASDTAQKLTDAQNAASVAKGHAIVADQQAAQARARAQELEAALAEATGALEKLKESVAALEGERDRMLAASAADHERIAVLERVAEEAHLHREQAEQSRLHLASLQTQLDDARTHLARERDRLAEVSGTIADLRASTIAMELERNYYRRRWPPYAVRRLASKAMARFRRHVPPAPPVDRFGLETRIGVMLTGLPEDPKAVLNALAAQTREPAAIVLPGNAPDAPASAVAHNWWSPDVANLTRGLDLVLLLHPQVYGAGPAWSPLLLEMAAAAFASDPALACLVYRGAAGPPATGIPNHLFETDAATIEHWPEEALAAVFRASELPRAFALANPGESRSIKGAIIAIARANQRTLIAPRTFPVNPVDAPAPPRAVPATPRPPLRALYATQWIECGGADKGIVDLITRADPSAVQFSLLTTVASAHAWEHRVRGHAREICHLGDHLPLPPDTRFPAFLVEFVRRREISVVHIMHSFLACDALPALKKALPQVRVLDQCHVLEPPDVMDGGHPAYASRRYKQLFDHRTVTNQWLKRYMMSEHGIADRDISVIYTGVDWEEEFNPDRFTPGEFRRRVAIPRDLPMVVFMGRLHPQKRPWLFVETLGHVQRTRPDLDAVWVMVGPGQERERVEALRATLPRPDRLMIVGEAQNAGSVFRDADLLFMPSGHEGLAYVSFEAMAMGVPQVFTDVNAQSELITPDTGILVPPEEDGFAPRAAQAVISLLEDPSKRAAMGKAARQRVAAHFGIKDMVARYEALYARLVRSA